MLSFGIFYVVFGFIFLFITLFLFCIGDTPGGIKIWDYVYLLGGPNIAIIVGLLFMKVSYTFGIRKNKKNEFRKIKKKVFLINTSIGLIAFIGSLVKGDDIQLIGLLAVYTLIAFVLYRFNKSTKLKDIENFILVKENSIKLKQGVRDISIQKDKIDKIKIGYKKLIIPEFPDESENYSVSEDCELPEEIDVFDEITSFDLWKIQSIVLKIIMIDGEEIRYEITEPYYFFRIYEYLKDLNIEKIKYKSVTYWVDDSCSIDLNTDIYYQTKENSIDLTQYFNKECGCDEVYEKVGYIDKIDNGILKIQELVEDARKKVNKEYYDLMFKEDIFHIVTCEDVGINLETTKICFDDNYIRFTYTEEISCLKLNFIDKNKNNELIPNDKRYDFEIVYDMDLNFIGIKRYLSKTRKRLVDYVN